MVTLRALVWLLAASCFTFAAVSAKAADFGLGTAADAVSNSVQHTSPGILPGGGLTARYAFTSADERAFIGFDATLSWVDYENPYLPEFLIRTRATWGWRFALTIPLDLAVGVTLPFAARRTSDYEIRYNKVLPVPTISVGTALPFDGWEVFARVRLETIWPSISVGVMWW